MVVEHPFGSAHAEGQTPLDPDDLEGLRPAYITTQAELNEAEHRNITVARRKVLRAPLRPDTILDDLWLRQLHGLMFDQVWQWAGSYRRRDLNIGQPWTRISVEVRTLIADAAVWVADQEPDEGCVAFHHRLVSIHPFLNGNGRHARLAADVLARSLGREPFSWGRDDLAGAGRARQRYLEALRTADGGDVQPLVRFARG